MNDWVIMIAATLVVFQIRVTTSQLVDALFHVEKVWLRIEADLRRWVDDE